MRRTLPHEHIRCKCGTVCPLTRCGCGNAQDHTRCQWCLWWDEHEPHDYPSPNFGGSVKFVVDMMNSGAVNPADVYPSGRYQGD